MLVPLTTAVVALSVASIGLAGLYALRQRLIDDWLLGVLALLELGVLVQAVVCLVRLGDLAQERATFAAYALSLPLIAPVVAFLAIKEKTRWSMGAVAVGAFAVGVMTGRLHQIWGLHA